MLYLLIILMTIAILVVTPKILDKPQQLRPLPQAIISSMLNNPGAWEWHEPGGGDYEKYMASYRCVDPPCVISVTRGYVPYEICAPMRLSLNASEARKIQNTFEGIQASRLLDAETRALSS